MQVVESRAELISRLSDLDISEKCDLSFLIVDLTVS